MLTFHHYGIIMEYHGSMGTSWMISQKKQIYHGIIYGIYGWFPLPTRNTINNHGISWMFLVFFWESTIIDPSIDPGTSLPSTSPPPRSPNLSPAPGGSRAVPRDRWDDRGGTEAPRWDRDSRPENQREFLLQQRWWECDGTFCGRLSTIWIQPTLYWDFSGRNGITQV